MSLKLRVMHVTPTAGARVWDVILLDGRRNVRLFPVTGDTTQFIDLVLEGTDTQHPAYLPFVESRRRAIVSDNIVKPISKSQRRKLKRRRK